MACSGPTWLVGLPATKNVCNFSYTNYTGGNHSVNLTFLAENVRSNQEMGSYLANVVSLWLIANLYFNPASLLQLCGLQRLAQVPHCCPCSHIQEPRTVLFQHSNDVQVQTNSQLCLTKANIILHHRETLVHQIRGELIPTP